MLEFCQCALGSYDLFLAFCQLQMHPAVTAQNPSYMTPTELCMQCSVYPILPFTFTGGPTMRLHVILSLIDTPTGKMIKYQVRIGPYLRAQAVLFSPSGMHACAQYSGSRNCDEMLCPGNPWHVDGVTSVPYTACSCQPVPAQVHHALHRSVLSPSHLMLDTFYYLALVRACAGKQGVLQCRLNCIVPGQECPP